VRRGDGPVTRMMGILGRLPPSADRAEVRLEVVAQGGRERWIRSFGKRKLTSLQWEENGLLVEQFPLMRFGFRIVREGDTLVHQLKRCWVGPLPIPLALAPRIFTTTKGSADGWRLTVRVEVPLLGRLIEYEGDIRCLW
jgi:hypothetical protein